MVRYSKISMFLVGLMVMACFAGVYSAAPVGKAIYVSKNGTDRNDGLTFNNPKRNIESAVASASSGDTIYVGPGTYNTHLNINKNITLIGNNQNDTVIDGQNTGRCITISGVTATITNLTIKKGNSEWGGGGIVSSGFLTLKDSTITDCTTVFGGAIYNYEAGVMNVSRVTIKNNKAEYGGGIGNRGGFDHQATLTMEDCIVANNTSTDGGGINTNCKSTLKLVRVVVSGNKASDVGGGIVAYGTAVIEDSFITDNVAGAAGGGIIVGSGAWLYLYGAVITNNKAADGGGLMNNNNAYVDDFSISRMTGNSPNNFAGIPHIPA